MGEEKNNISGIAKTKDALVSVIIPLYNREQLVKRAVESVVAQTFKNWHLVIIDDCSTDNSFQVASSFEDPRISVIKTKKNSGAAHARNFGIKEVLSKYVAFLDSDD